MLTYATKAPAVAAASAVQLDGFISYGQSWRSNSFNDFQSFGLNPYGPTAFMVPTIGAGLGPGPMPGSVGIALTALPTGTTTYIGSDYFQLGRCAALAQQLLRIRDGSPAPAILEFCTAYPGSTWHSGRGGGLSPGASFTGSIAGMTLTVSTVTSGFVAGGQLLAGAGINAQTMIYANLTLARTDADTAALLLDNNDDLDVQQLIPGGAGTYQLSLYFTSLSAQMGGASPAAVFTASASNGVISVSAIQSGSMAVNQVITAGGLTTGAIIQQQLNGTPGGIGDYLLGLPQTVASETMQAKGVSWTNMLAILGATPPGQGCFPTRRYTNLLLSSVGYTQGGAADNTQAGKVADLTDMVVQFDALALNSTPLKFYLGLPAALSTSTVTDPLDSSYGTAVFARQHAPGAGGTYSGRVYATGPSYPFQFNGNDNIHTGDYGSTRWGEIEGYARWCVQDKGIAWTPLWRPLTGGAITRSGQVLTVPFARPGGPDFAAGAMSWQNNVNDGIKDWPQKGFHVRRSGVELTASPAISGMNVLLTIAETLSPGDSLEVSYAWYGPGGTNPGPNTGIGGNLVMNGPPSVLYPNGWQGEAKSIDAWAWPFIETVTV